MSCAKKMHRYKSEKMNASMKGVGNMIKEDDFVNPPRSNASVMDEASHRIRPKMSRMQGVPDCCFRQHGISDYRYSLSSAHLVTRQISDLPLMCQVPQISELG